MSESFYLWQISLIHWIQQKLFFLDGFFRLLPFANKGLVILLFLVLVWLVWGRREGLHFSFLVMGNFLLSLFLKFLFHAPRPVFFDPTLPLISVSSYGFPSGDVQTSVLFAALFIRQWNRWWNWLIGLNYVFWICLSRVYLGVHFPSDVLGGLLSGLLVFSFYLFGIPYFDRFREKAPRCFFLLFIGLSFLLLLVPISTYVKTLLGGLIGLLVGVWLSRDKPFSSAGSFRRSVYRGGILLVGFLFFVLLIRTTAFFYFNRPVLEFFYFCALGFWLAFGIPWFESRGFFLKGYRWNLKMLQKKK